MSKIDRNIFIVIIAIQLTLLSYIGYALYMQHYYLEPAIEFTNTPFQTDKRVYRQGDPIIISVHRCRYTDIPSTVFVEIVDGIVVNLAPKERSGGRIGCYSLDSHAADIPDDYPPGDEVFLRGKVEIELPVIGRPKRIAIYETEKFSVIAK